MSRELNRKSLEWLKRGGALRDVDFFLADTLARQYQEESPVVLLTAAMASRLVDDGHVCLALDQLADSVWPAEETGAAQERGTLGPENAARVTLPALEAWRQALRESSVCTVVGDTPLASDETARPLVLVDQQEAPRLYLARYYRYERIVVDRLSALAKRDELPVDMARNDRLVTLLFPENDQYPDAHEQPRKAAVEVLARRLLVVSGGPGRGKTHTLARLLVLLVDALGGGDTKPVIRMAAPTGKAAMRMSESIRDAKKDLATVLDGAGFGDLVENIPEEAATLHRLLGAGRGIGGFRYNADNPLPASIVIVDEASMVDLPMMAKLLGALSDKTRLVLLGDKDQLSSVDPGYVLGDICAAAQAQAGPLAGSLVELTHSWRFAAGGAVGTLSEALCTAGTDADPEGEHATTVLRGVAQATMDADKDGDLHGVAQLDCPDSLRDGEGRPVKALRERVFAAYTPFLNAREPADVFKALQQFRILSPRRSGPHGVSTLNKLVEEVLSLKRMTVTGNGELQPGRKLNPSGRFYDHRVVMVKQNDYGMRLFNGDVGVVLPENADGRAIEDPAKPGLFAWFEAYDQATGKIAYRSVPCSMLPEHETAFAMTIHKSQGSQFRDLLVVVPPGVSPLLKKELIYTAVTRAEKRVDLWCSEESFKQAALAPTDRFGGLRDALAKGVGEVLQKVAKLERSLL